MVDHGPLDDAALPEARLSGPPDLRIGVVSGEPAFQWDQLFAADRMSDGTLVALDRGGREVRAFATDGRHLWTSGGEGEGPGEFRFPWSLSVLDGDSLLLTDPGTGRMTVLGPQGEFVRDVLLDSREGAVVGLVPVLGEVVFLEPRTLEVTEIGRHRAVVNLSRFRAVDTEGAPVVELGTYDLDVRYQEGGDEDGAFSGAIFDEPAVFAPHPEGLWHGDAESYAVTLHGEGGRVLRIVRWEGPDRTITDDDLARLEEVWSEEFAVDRQRARWLERYFANHPVASAMATMSRLLVDRSANLWIQEYERPDRPHRPSTWLVLSPDGERALGRLTHPRAFEPFAVGDEWILGATEDELGVEYLALYRYELPGS